MRRHEKAARAPVLALVVAQVARDELRALADVVAAAVPVLDLGVEPVHRVRLLDGDLPRVVLGVHLEKHGEREAKYIRYFLALCRV